MTKTVAMFVTKTSTTLTNHSVNHGQLGPKLLVDGEDVENPEEKADEVDGENDSSNVKARVIGDEAKHCAHTKQDNC